MLPLRDALPTRRRPVVTYLLITANLLVFLWQVAVAKAGVAIELVQGLVPARFMAQPFGELDNVFSSMFMHATVDEHGQLYLWHLAGNMLFLWIFGDNVEDELGRWRYLGLYLASGVAAAAAQIAIHPTSLLPMVGASGAISGVLAAYLTLHPRSPITVLNPVPILWLIWGITFRLPAWVVIGQYFLLNLVNGIVTIGSTGGGVAFFAHLGGFAAGLVLVRLLFKREPPKPDPWEGWSPPPRYDFRPASRSRW